MSGLPVASTARRRRSSGGARCRVPPRAIRSCLSPALGRPIALALLTRGSQRIGEHVRVYHLGAETEALIVRTPFYDPEGRRVHG
jgi:sarcosine oxidase subunit alpha